MIDRHYAQICQRGHVITDRTKYGPTYAYCPACDSKALELTGGLPLTLASRAYARLAKPWPSRWGPVISLYRARWPNRPADVIESSSTPIGLARAFVVVALRFRWY